MESTSVCSVCGGHLKPERSFKLRPHTVIVGRCSICGVTEKSYLFAGNVIAKLPNNSPTELWRSKRRKVS